MSTLHLSVGQNLAPPPAENSSTMRMFILWVLPLGPIWIFLHHLCISSLSLDWYLSFFPSICLLSYLLYLPIYPSIYLIYLSHMHIPRESMSQRWSSFIFSFSSPGQRAILIWHHFWVIPRQALKRWQRILKGDCKGQFLHLKLYYYWKWNFPVRRSVAYCTLI